jgi:regulation of enolase protein 1 (concanavalin A-like superfamily)
MKIRIFVAPFAIALLSIADEPAALKKTTVPGWGTCINPAGDCKFSAENGTLKITVPGFDNPHDLGPELGNTTAPRVVQPVAGDFVIQVKITGEFEPGDESTQPGRTGYTGAGLVVFADENNFVRLERATLHGQGDESHPYTNFEIRVDGQIERFGTTGDLPTDKDKPTWLRLERKGNQMLGAMSQDGENWTYGEPKNLRAQAWSGNNIVAGVAAISTSRRMFTPTYSAFSLQQGAKPKTEKSQSK